MLKVVSFLWEVNGASFAFSRCYDESWVCKLYDGFARHLSRPWQFTLFTDKWRAYGNRDILQILLDTHPPGYGACTEAYRLDDPIILVGLDTIVTGNIDHLADYCMTADKIALPADPFNPTTVCNGVVLVPAGFRKQLYDPWKGENDLAWMREQPHALIDALFPGHVVSYKGFTKYYGLGDTRIVYFHGEEKPHQLPDVDWIARHWCLDAA